MASEWYSIINNEELKIKIDTFLNQNFKSDHCNLVRFKNNMSEEEINKYIPYNIEAYKNTIGLKASESIEEEIASFKRDLFLKNDGIRTSDNYYYFIVADKNIIGKANCRVSFSRFRSMTFEFLFISKEHQNRKIGKNIFYQIIRDIINEYEIEKIRLEILPTNIPAIKLVESLGFKK